ncbi:MAG: FkbM family methyltransferase [Opitutae bacterium]|nr:FkbM family methyltransferase [Opitutae bacterium]
MIISSLIRKIFNERFIDSVKALYDQNIRNEQKIRELPRFTRDKADILTYSFDFPDARSFISMREDIWNKQIYYFRTKSQKPYIVDCGSNIGLSVIYFKHLFPDARIAAFEPDPKLFQYLSDNLADNSFTDIEIHQKAVCDSNAILPFKTDGADGGKITASNSDQMVQTVSLNEFLKTKVDLLKLDIEGNELKVLRSCKEHLHLVRNLFIEYHSFKDKAQELSEILRILEQHGFRYFLNSATPRNCPFDFVSEEDMDLQINIYAKQIQKD